MAVITISRELGSLGTYIARQTASVLACPLVDKTSIETILERIKNKPEIDEKIIDAAYLNKKDLPNGEMIYLYDRVIHACARWGDVVMLGRGSFAALAHFADALHVRIQAPFDLRVQRLLAEASFTSQDEVEALIRESDQVRSDFIMNWYRVQWEAATNYHLVIDTGKIPPDMAVSWLAEEFNVLKGNQYPDRMVTSGIEVVEPIQTVVDDILNG